MHIGGSMDVVQVPQRGSKILQLTVAGSMKTV
jgi:hypothetical protein